MTNYFVRVRLTGYREFVVVAESKEEAEDAARCKVWNSDWNYLDDADAIIDKCSEVKEDE